METFVIKSNTLTLTFEKEFGCLVGVYSQASGWNILDRPHLGRNWELMIPLEGRRNNPVYGYKHKVKSVEIAPDGKKAVFTWNKVTSEFGGEHDVNIIITVEAIGDAILWRTNIENNDDVVVENVCSPIIGDLRPPKDAKKMETFWELYSGPSILPLYPVFANTKGYWGVDVPTILPGGGPPFQPPFYLVNSDVKAGLYSAPYDNINEFFTWRHRLFPGQISFSDSAVPKEDFIGGKEVYAPFDAVHLPFIAKGEKRELTPIHLEGYAGDWTKGTDIYKKRREAWNWSLPGTPDWAKQPHSWLQLHINSPEDELRLRFTELPKVAQECKDYGISAIQLVGWNHGGQDQGNPSHDPDPRLGTFEELKNAIAECHKIGVKIILFAKFTWADFYTKWYEDDLYKYAIKDLHGGIYLYGGYQYQTVSQLMDVGTKRFATMCFWPEELRAIYRKEFQKLVDLGAAGMLYDESQHHGAAHMCFSEEHGHRRGAFSYAKDIQLIDEFRQIAPKDFLMCGECCYDLQMTTYDLSYFRTYGPDELPSKRYARPDSGLYMIAVPGFDDRDTINKCLMCNYIVSYEPYYFKGMPSDFPLTMEYGGKMQELREETKEYTWYGEFCEKHHASVTNAEGKEHAHYSVFKNKAGNCAVVVTNYTGEPITVEIALEKGAVSKYKAVDGEWANGNKMTIAPHTAIVALEK